MKANTVEIKALPSWFRECKFDPRRDVAEVEQGLAVDINEALRTGVVKDAEYALQYNGIDEPGKIVGRIQDKFDAIEAHRVVKKYGKQTKVEQVATAGAVEPSAGAVEPSAGAPAASAGGSGSSN
jgi:hypothetical protein